MALEKPALVPSGSITDVDIGVSGGKFYIKIIDGDYLHGSPTVETTGDGDTAPVHENTGELYGTYVLNGAMVATDAIGLANIVNTTNNPTADVTINLGSTRQIIAPMLIESIRLRYQRTGVFVGIRIRMKASGTAPSEALIS